METIAYFIKSIIKPFKAFVYIGGLTNEIPQNKRYSCFWCFNRTFFNHPKKFGSFYFVFVAVQHIHGAIHYLAFSKRVFDFYADEFDRR